MKITIVGCGDAFGSGGRLNTCFHVETNDKSFLIDCGATALPGLKRLGIARNPIDLILVTHFHADHVGGIPPFILDAQFLSRRTADLTIAGPPGLADGIRARSTSRFRARLPPNASSRCGWSSWSRRSGWIWMA